MSLPAGPDYTRIIWITLDVVGVENLDLTLDNVTLSPVPVPSALCLLGSGLVGLVGFRRKIREA